MEATSPHKYDHTHCDVLTEPCAETNTIAMLGEIDMKPENFYLTGFEAISFNRRKSFAIETVLSSVSTFDSEILILNTGDRSFSLSTTCNKLYLNYQIVDANEIVINYQYLKDILSHNRKITHIVICEDDTFSLQPDQMRKFGELAAQHKVDLIVECGHKPLSIKQVIEFGVSFLVSPLIDGANKSLILARRSRLVQSEGRSRSMVHDLYRYWQRVVARRTHIIEPMAI